MGGIVAAHPLRAARTAMPDTAATAPPADERLARWRIEAGPEISTHENGVPRTTEAIMRDVNHAFEEAVKHDPANWFWVHNSWKPARPKRKLKRATTELANAEDEG